MARRVRRGAAVAVVLSLSVTLQGSLAHGSSADELVREARVHEAAHEDDLALRRYAEALAIDPTEEDAYLGLAAIRLRLGDAREAERVYATALAHVPSLASARLGRARALRALRSVAEADADLEAYVAATNDPDAMRELAGWYQSEARPLAQLATWRRLLSFAERHDDARLKKEARLTVHALELIVGPADPVRAPGDDRGASDVRRGMARAEKRR